MTKRLHDFQRNEVTEEALRRDMTNMNRLPFTDEIEQAEPPHEFNMPHFTSFKGDGDPERHLKHYRNAMILYRNKDDLMCKIFTTTLQGSCAYKRTLPSMLIKEIDFYIILCKDTTRLSFHSGFKGIDVD